MKSFPFLVFSLVSIPVWAQNLVKVRVVDDKNAPVAGALVEVRAWGEKAQPIPPVRANAGGVATLSLPEKPSAKQVRALMATAKGFWVTHAVINGPNVEVRLERGATWRGQVVDEAGKPIQGAKISVLNAMEDNDFRNAVWLEGTKTAEKYVARSGADGRFQIADVTTRLNLDYRVAHPRYAAVRGRNVSIGSEEIVKLAPGGTLRGRLLDVPGQPLPKVRIYASKISAGSGWGETLTDQNGAFVIESLAAGQYRVRAELPQNAKYVVPRNTTVRVVAGKVSPAPPMRAIVGTEIRGLVRDAQTKKPLAGASVGSRQGEEYGGQGTSDTTGHFTLRVVPGRYKISVSGAPAGYLRPDSQQSIDATIAAPELTFDLKKATVISGLTVDDAGKPIAARLTAGWPSEIESDAAGKWSFTPSSNEALSLGGGEDENGYFEVVGTDKWETPIKSPVIVRVRRRAWNTLTGRTVATDGTPLQGIRVAVSFLVPMGDGMFHGGNRNAVSDAQGRFVISKIRAGRESKISGQKEGFTPQNSGKIARNGANWTSDDLVFAALNRRIEGTTTPGARVVAAGREVVAAADGKFAFDGLAAGEVLVVAAKGDQFGSAVAKEGTALKIALAKAPVQARDPELAAKFQAEALGEASGEGRKYVEDWLSEPDGALSFEAALQKAAQSPANERYKALNPAISAYKTGDSLAALRLSLDSIEDSDLRTAGYLKAAIAIPDADLAKRALEMATENFKISSKYISTRETQLYQAAVVAERVEGQKAGFTALDRALAFTLQSHGEKTIVAGVMQTETGRDEVMAEHADTVAAGSLALLRRLFEAIEPGTGNDIRALAHAIPTVARVHGVAAALPLLEELKRKPVPQPEAGARRYVILEPEYAFGVAARALIPLLAAQSPSKSLELARRVTSEEHRARALATAARFQSGEIAAKTWREAVQAGRPDDAPRFAAFAWQNDPKLGAELFEIAYQKAEAAMDSQRNFSNAWVPFAFYSARANPALARLVLEREWAKSLRKNDIEGYHLADFAAAMAPLDARRAWEMTRQLPPDGGYNWALGVRHKIARSLVMSEAARHTSALSAINAAEVWEADDAN